MSSDFIIVIVPGPLPNTVDNKCVAQVFKSIKSNRLQPPKLGKIDIAHVELLLRAKAKSSVQCVSENYIRFASEKNTILPRMKMGDHWRRSLSVNVAPR